MVRSHSLLPQHTKPTSILHQVKTADTYNHKMRVQKSIANQHRSKILLCLGKPFVLQQNRPCMRLWLRTLGVNFLRGASIGGGSFDVGKAHVKCVPGWPALVLLGRRGRVCGQVVCRVLPTDSGLGADTRPPRTTYTHIHTQSHSLRNLALACYLGNRVTLRLVECAGEGGRGGREGWVVEGRGWKGRVGLMHDCACLQLRGRWSG